MYNTNTDILLVSYQVPYPCSQPDNDDHTQAGALAAFTVDFFVYPLDTLKTRLQSPDYKRLFTDASTQAANKRLLFRGLYQGVGSVIIATLPACADPHI